MAKNGGARPGAGRKKGGKNAATLEKEAVLAAYRQRIMGKADELFNAQWVLASGAIQIFHIVEKKSRGKTRREHILITDPKKIKAVLDANDGLSGQFEDEYYQVVTVQPDNRAIEAMLNRAFGKPTETLEIGNKPGEEFKTEFKINVVHSYKKHGTND